MEGSTILPQVLLLLQKGEDRWWRRIRFGNSIRNRMDVWLDYILQDEVDDKNQKLSQLEGDEYSLTAVKTNCSISLHLL